MRQPVPIRQPTLVTTVLLVGLVAVVALLHEVVLLTFAGIFLAVALSRTAEAVSRRLGVSRRAGLVATLLSLVGAALATGAFLAPEASEQISRLVDTLPKALAVVRQALDGVPGLRMFLPRPGSPGETAGAEALVRVLQSVAAHGTEIATAVVYVAFIAFYSALEPDLYLEGFLRALPRRGRGPARAVLVGSASKLYLWFLSRLLLMSVVGVLTTIALWLSGVPMALTLGVLSGLLLFIPYVGAIVSAIPAILVAAPEGLGTVGWVVLVYIGVHVLEGYVLYPWIQEKSLSLPAALTLAFQAVLGTLFGILGLTLAPAVLIVVLRAFDELEPAERVDSGLRPNADGPPTHSA